MRMRSHLPRSERFARSRLAKLLHERPFLFGLKPLGLNSKDSYLAKDQRIEASENSTSTKSSQSFNLAQAIRTRNFWILFFVYGFWVLGMTIPIVHLVPYATDIGLAAKRAASIQALVGGTSIFGRVSLGALTERMGPKISLIGLIWFQMLTMLWLIISHSEWMLWIFTILFGFSCGGLASVFPLMTVGLFGLKALGAIFGLILLGATLGYLFIFTNLRIIVKSKLKVSLKPTLYSVGLGWFRGNTQNNKLI